MKKVLSVVLALAMLFSMMVFTTISVSAAPNYTAGGFGYIGTHFNATDAFLARDADDRFFRADFRVYADPAEWERTTGMVLVIDYSEF